MGGVLEVMGNVSPVASANILGDPHAADIVLGTDWNVTLVPGDTTRQVKITDDFLARIRDHGGSTGRFLHDISLFYRDFYRSVGATDGFYAHDPTPWGLDWPHVRRAFPSASPPPPPSSTS